MGPRIAIETVAKGFWLVERLLADVAYGLRAADAGGLLGGGQGVAGPGMVLFDRGEQPVGAGKAADLLVALEAAALVADRHPVEPAELGHGAAEPQEAGLLGGRVLDGRATVLGRDAVLARAQHPEVRLLEIA